MHLQPRVLAHEHARRARVVEVDVREEQVPDVAEHEPTLAQPLLQLGNARRRPAVEEGQTALRLEQVDADDAVAAEMKKVERLRHAGGQLRYAPAAAVESASATSRSSSRSSADSRPTDRRIRFGGAANGESTVEACVISAGTSIRLSTPPRLSA